MTSLQMTLEFHGSVNRDAREASQASLEISVDGTALTEVMDVRSQSTRRHIRVPTLDLARWFLVNWWRLRWEPQRETLEWRYSHALPAIGGGYVWPNLSFASDGQQILGVLKNEPVSKAASIHYLKAKSFEILATDFEAAVDKFVADVSARVEETNAETSLRELLAELTEERTDPQCSLMCQLQARAGLDPGDAPDDWMNAANALVSEFGRSSASECLAVGLPPTDIRECLLSIERKGFEIDLGWLKAVDASPVESGLQAWQLGEAHARQVRAWLGHPTGPFRKEHFKRLGVGLPSNEAGRRDLGGAVLARSTTTARVAIPTRPETSRRLYMGRVLGHALASRQPEEQALPITGQKTYLQKYGRAFANELLCPWNDLAERLDERGDVDDVIDDVANIYEVSPLQLKTALVNKGWLQRRELVV